MTRALVLWHTLPLMHTQTSTPPAISRGRTHLLHWECLWATRERGAQAKVSWRMVLASCFLSIALGWCCILKIGGLGGPWLVSRESRSLKLQGKWLVISWNWFCFFIFSYLFFSGREAPSCYQILWDSVLQHPRLTRYFYWSDIDHVRTMNHTAFVTILFTQLESKTTFIN
jgi:hypothetical protein